ncbi:hypothetical protein PHLCEN_2v1905 [Hermanssonia centrifuga]|uniref:Uncharacterized protein n=1 Tax=Hermanssonia centrifuga TaxID=98765 RepID=A0A2R6RVN1_9APHY|nr:hypothetical protein PHLCEN_2v1905 [Hermanssonia centrifuga]
MTATRLVRDDQLPRFLYPDGHEYNSKDEADKLCQGHVFIRVARHILLGPKKAINTLATPKGHGGNAKIMGIRAMTPRLAAYIAVQAHFAISDIQEWCLDNREYFQYDRFFWNLVDILESEAGPNILQLLDE